MTDEEFEEYLNDIEYLVSLSVAALGTAKGMLCDEVDTVYPDEAAALHQCRNDLAEVILSIQRRRKDGLQYNQPTRVAELIDKLSKTSKERDSDYDLL
ncbi:hypothetical protein [Halogeometricum sp. CBA1124]|uniref:hypothetical protein n=1 Tax=Halogeometricum sp. CBA1124 TaxID=2668071 RepID=UPI00142B1206|nr:hypothetical protein [Halogeometricum sp. CBA1124]MUV56226.1 hypothetical protein [Halogeometricum sp. CBA1124]